MPLSAAGPQHYHHRHYVREILLFLPCQVLLAFIALPFDLKLEPPLQIESVPINFAMLGQGCTHFLVDHVLFDGLDDVPGPMLESRCDPNRG